MQSFLSYPSPTQVPAFFVPQQPNVLYRIVNIKQQHKALTVTNDPEHKLTISDYTNGLNQKFLLVQQDNIYAFVVQTNSSALCVYYNSTQDGAKVVADQGKYDSSWFGITRAPAGEYANKGYMLSTFAKGNVLGIEGGNTKDGSNVIQNTSNCEWNQIWSIVPADAPYQKPQRLSWGFDSGQFIHHQQNNNQGFQPNKQDTKSLTSNAGYFQAGQTYALICVENPSKCIEHRNGSVIVNDFNGSANQRYTFEYDKSLCLYCIRTITNNLYLNGPGAAGGGDIVLKNKGNAFQFGEQWTIERDKKVPNAYSIRSFSGHAMNVPASDYSNGNKIQKHEFYGGYNQLFLICER